MARQLYARHPETIRRPAAMERTLAVTSWVLSRGMIVALIMLLHALASR